MNIKPMLAYKATVSDLDGKYLVAQPKIDGVRALTTRDLSGRVVFQSRSGKSFKNLHVNSSLARYLPPGLDGELVLADGKSDDCCRKTTSILNSYSKPLSTIRYIIFDRWDRPQWSFKDRFASLPTELPPWASLCPTIGPTYNIPWAIGQFAGDGWLEGTIFRDHETTYKHGRSTLREAKLIAIKPFTDAEAKVISTTELLHNTNPLARDELGFAKRSSAKAGKVPSGLMGTLICRSSEWPEPFEIGTGFDTQLRRKFFLSPPIGATVKYKYLPTGSMDRPRCPVFLSLRMEEDT